MGESKLLGPLLATVGTVAIGWGVAARPEFGDLPTRLASLGQLLSHDRLGSSFVVDLGLFALFQGWLVDDDLRRRGVDPAAAGALRTAARFVPFYGLCAYLTLRPPLPTRPTPSASAPPPTAPAGAAARGGGVRMSAAAAAAPRAGTPRMAAPASSVAREAEGGAEGEAGAGAGAGAEETFDVVVIGAGLGGLSAAALSARYGLSVLVCEAHSIAGGCAHSFERRGYVFDSGPSLWSGCAAPSTNPMRQVLDAVGESPEWEQYEQWCMYTPEGDFFATAGDMGEWRRTMARLGDGEATVAQWDALIDFIEPLQRAVLAVPPLALRADLGALLTAGPYLKAMADPRIGLKASLLSGPWSAVLDAAGVTDKWLRHWFDFLAFAFSGLPSDGTVAAAMVYMLADLHRDGARMDYPRGGSGAVVDALVRGLTKHGGELRLRSAVAEVLVAEGADGELGRCTGVRLAGGQVVHARRAVVSNAPVWQTASLLPAAARDAVRSRATGSAPLDASTPPTPSFMHLHLGIRADGLSEQARPSAQ